MWVVLTATFQCYQSRPGTDEEIVSTHHRGSAGDSSLRDGETTGIAAFFTCLFNASKTLRVNITSSPKSMMRSFDPPANDQNNGDPNFSCSSPAANFIPWLATESGFSFYNQAQNQTYETAPDALSLAMRFLFHPVPTCGCKCILIWMKYPWLSPHICGQIMANPQIPNADADIQEYYRTSNATMPSQNWELESPCWVVTTRSLKLSSLAGPKKNISNPISCW